MVIYSAVSPFVLSYIILVLRFILATFARFFFDVRLFCSVVSGGLNIRPISLIELFYISQSYFVLGLVFVCCCVCFYVIYDKKMPTFLGVGFCFCVFVLSEYEIKFFFNTSF